MADATKDRGSSVLSVAAMIALVIVCVSLAAPPSSAPAETNGPVGARATPHIWKFRRILGERTAELSVGWTACKREFQPTFRIHVTEKRRRATITIFERAHRVPSGTRCFRSRGKSPLRVRLNRPVEDLKLLDGSTSPPTLRFTGGDS